MDSAWSFSSTLRSRLFSAAGLTFEVFQLGFQGVETFQEQRPVRITLAERLDQVIDSQPECLWVDLCGHVTDRFRDRRRVGQLACVGPFELPVLGKRPIGVEAELDDVRKRAVALQPQRVLARFDRKAKRLFPLRPASVPRAGRRLAGEAQSRIVEEALHRARLLRGVVDANGVRRRNRESDVVYVPYLMGSRYSQEPLKAQLLGLTQQTEREEILAAIVKGLCEYQKAHLTEIGKDVSLHNVIHATGGALNSTLLKAKKKWMRDCEYVHEQQSSMKGAALLGSRYIETL